MEYSVERMNDAFTKYHLNREGEAPWPFRPVLHHFTQPDYGDPHDHPWSFTSFVMSGGYVEEVFSITNGVWRSEIVHRLPGTSHHVLATHIHRIIDLPEGECWTMVLGGPHERETRFWRFGEHIESRAWHEHDFRLVGSAQQE
jgi:hypothetical protein